jgi:hypothetical protein
MLCLFGVGAVLVFINFLALRQAVTLEPMLGRMTSTMRWLTLLPAGPGAAAAGSVNTSACGGIGVRRCRLAAAGTGGLAAGDPRRAAPRRSRCTWAAPRLAEGTVWTGSLGLRAQPGEAVDGVGDDVDADRQQLAGARRVIDRVDQRAGRPGAGGRAAPRPSARGW